MDSSPLQVAIPRPGPGLKVVLILLGAVGIFTAILTNFVAGGARVFELFDGNVSGLHHWQLWRLITSGVLTDPLHQSHLLFSLVGIYFLSPTLESQWGTARFIRFLCASVVAGNLLVLGLDSIAPHGSAFAWAHPTIVYGPGAALVAVAAAWALTNAHATVNLFFFLPIRGAHFLWLTIAYCFFGLFYAGDAVPEGAMASFGGLIAGLLLGGTPSVVRGAYLRLRLAFLRRRNATFDPFARRTKRGSHDGPPLRIVQGGLEDELKKRKPPKDKRYLN